MRVTKLIKEYVEEEVRKAFAGKNKEIEEKEKFLKMIEEEINEENKKFLEMAEKKVQEIIKKYNLQQRENYYRKLYDKHYPISFANYATTIYEEIDALKNENRNEIEKTIKNILIELEMGATKKQLDEMIANLGKEV